MLPRAGSPDPSFLMISLSSWGGPATLSLFAIHACDGISKIDIVIVMFGCMAIFDDIHPDILTTCRLKAENADCGCTLQVPRRTLTPDRLPEAWRFCQIVRIALIG